MERVDVVELEVHLEERLPVARHVIDEHAIEHVLGKIEIRCHRKGREVGTRIARALEQQPVPIGERLSSAA
jgi:hypothetical protein